MLIVMEIQKNGEQVATVVNSYADRSIADQKYHTILAAAAVSSVDLHSAVMLDDDGHEIKHESYVHGDVI